MSNLCGLLTDLGGWLGSWQTLKPAVRCHLLLGVVPWGSAASRGAEADPWAPGHSRDDWRMIAVLQQYPGFAPRPPSEIKTWLSHPNPHVRAAGMDVEAPGTRRSAQRVQWRGWLRIASGSRFRLRQSPLDVVQGDTAFLLATLGQERHELVTLLKFGHLAIECVRRFHDELPAISDVA
jgi:hypothetical protein